MRMLDLQSALDGLPPSGQALVGRVNPHVSADDGMYQGDADAHYVGCGASAINVILSALQVGGSPAPRAVLDFGAGAGRVTRWLRAAFPDAAIAACDLRPQDMRFCRDEFGADTWISGTDVSALAAPGRYDLIWVGSVLTHLPAETSGRLIDKLLSWTEPGGLLIMSTIGRTAKARRDEAGNAYIHNEAWDRIARDYDATGFGYADYQKQQGYGLSLTRLSWTSSLVESIPGARLVLLAEAAWDGLHDIVAIQNVGLTPLDPHESKGDAECFAIARASSRSAAAAPGLLSKRAAHSLLRSAARLLRP